MDTDVKNKNVTDMTDREIAEETLHKLRAFEEILVQFSNHPMAKMIPGLGNGKR